MKAAVIQVFEAARASDEKRALITDWLEPQQKDEMTCKR